VLVLLLQVRLHRDDADAEAVGAAFAHTVLLESVMAGSANTSQIANRSLLAAAEAIVNKRSTSGAAWCGW
jgi:hypothetical protein